MSLRAFYFLRCLVLVCQKPLKSKKRDSFYKLSIWNHSARQRDSSVSRCQNGSTHCIALLPSSFSFYLTQQRLLCSLVSQEKHYSNTVEGNSQTRKIETSEWESVRSELRRTRIDLCSESGSYIELNTCPLCATNAKRRLLPRIHKIDGSFHCSTCDETYSNSQLLERLKLLNGTFSPAQENILFDRTVIDSNWLIEFAKDSIKNLEENKEMIASLEKSGLSFRILRDFEAGLARFRRNSDKRYDDFLVFPLRNERLELVGVKCRRIERYEDVGYYRLNSSFGLFGLHLGNEHQDSVIVSEDEIEAMKITESCGMVAVSLPCGIDYFGEDVIRCLSIYSKVYIWFGNEPLYKERACVLAKKLGLMRCYVISPPEKLSAGAERPSDLIRMQVPLTPFISMAEPAVQPKYISDFSDCRNDIYKTLAHPKENLFLATDCYSLTNFSRFTKGLRRNEVSLYVGESGVGKSTFLSQLVLDYCRQGIPTLWCSFASDQSFIMKTMLEQLAAVDSKTLVSHFSRFSSIFESLPLHFVNLSNREDIEFLEEAIAYAQQMWKVTHVVVDNINIPRYFRGDKLNCPKEMLEKTLHLLKHVTVTNNIHISAVTLPWIESYCHRGMDVQVTELFGSSSVALEADNVFFIKRTYPAENLDTCRTICILKHRWDGNTGTINLKQNVETKLLQDVKLEYSNVQINSPSEQNSSSVLLTDHYSLHSQDSLAEPCVDDFDKELIEVNMTAGDLAEWERLLDVRD
ncbi:Twinkle protein, mitochondrial [Galdieria sulphuraria]|uniref:Mitochondrial helicase twinkle n=1 Tax=Galdieria sulphuraria TaxID=130081 RepID=M2X750_GALSU|nr:mitochondrial helicase twinkle [Galdieria sulphuraria]EME32325.1 mitochondrial helicase twinkle [Galdieria sulphuraria]GJD07170.1 Twinkle protein, mitochondrial [Galdieria sulphuraria]|eukprot:XP_005708845.1 mitochondrial helicase twinkle [Galdieria sulphuraria]